MESTRKIPSVACIAGKMHSFFNDPQVEQLARDTQFVQRRSRLSGLGFLKTLVLGFVAQPAASLNQLAQSSQDCDICISPQGLDERINAHSVAFLEQVFLYAMRCFQQRCSLALPLLHCFSAIHILDSTFLSLPAAMQTEFPGAGGSGSPASLKIQLVFEFLSGQFEQICLQAGRQADQAYRDYLQVVHAGSLTVVDLGYFCLDAFAAIASAQAYFLSRYHYPTALLTPDGVAIDLPQRLSQAGAATLDLPIRLGSRARHRLPARLIARRVSEAVAAERRRKVKHRAKLHHKTLSAAYLRLLHWDLFVTNLPLTLAAPAQILRLYHVRWQIELLFKLWKSYAGLKTIGPWRRERILTELYAKLIGCVLFQCLSAPLRLPDDPDTRRELSPFKAHQIFARFALRLMEGLSDLARLGHVLEDLVRDLLRFGLKQSRVKDPNVFQTLAVP